MPKYSFSLGLRMSASMTRTLPCPRAANEAARLIAVKDFPSPAAALVTISTFEFEASHGCRILRAHNRYCAAATESGSARMTTGLGRIDFFRPFDLLPKC